MKTLIITIGLASILNAGLPQLAWNKSPEPNVRAYRVYCVTATTTNVYRVEGTNSFRLTEDIVQPGITYTFYVSALGTVTYSGTPSADALTELESELSDPVTLTIANKPNGERITP